MKKMDKIREQVRGCIECGKEYRGKSACGVGAERKNIVLMVGMNPWTEDGKFKNGRGITKLFDYLNKWNFEDYFMDNIVKCEMPDKKHPKVFNVQNCKKYLFDQIAILSPCYIILFGEFAARHMGFPYKPWEEVVPNKTSVIPHFSSFLYGKDKKKKEEEYYEKLKFILLDAPKQLSLF